MYEINYHNEFKFVLADIECLPPRMRLYSHLPVFTNTYFGINGGSECQEVN